MPSDIEIQKAVADCQKGELTSFSVIYDAYINKVYNFLFYRCLHKETSEDLTSQTFFKALDRIKTFDHNKSQIQTWLFQIAKNSLIDHWRKNRPQEDLETWMDLPSGTDIPNEVSAKLELEELQKKLSILSKIQREVIVLRVWDGLSHKEIGEILNISEANSKMHLSRSLQKIKNSPGLLFLLFSFISQIKNSSF